MVERDIENKIVEALKTLGLEDVQIINSWNTDQSFLNVEDDSFTSIVDIHARPRQYDTAQIPTANIDCSIAAYTRTDGDPTGQKMLDLSEKLMDMIQSFQDDLSLAISTFEVPKFQVAGFRISGGNGPFRDVAKGYTGFQIDFTLRGVIQ